MGCKKLLLSLFILLIIPIVVATDHYSFEHAKEMLDSGRVEWRDYGPEAFQESIDENKPIFLILTAPSWCYWCHVYTSDDYVYNENIYPILNNDFIPIYVDADKRQDLTRQFLEGGWPSTTVFTPGRERLFGFSGPRPIPFMLENFKRAVDFVNSQGFSNKILHDYEKTPQIIPTESQLSNLVNGYTGYVNNIYDNVNGGFGTGQKFPQGRALDFALEVYEQTGNEQFLDLVKTTLKNQYTKLDEIETNYNLFDPIEGGFHRYGTTREWTPPHYEKMLYDNARLLKAYSHLLQITPDDKLAQEVVKKTDDFIQRDWYDKENGGFYGNSDADGEDEYYGKAERPNDKPRIERTKYTDWNSQAISTYLYLWTITNNEKYKEIAEKSLNFYAKEMITDKGPYHFKKIDGEKGVRGTLLDNSYLLLAFIEGYETLEDEEYLKTAIKIADFSLDNLYDWNSGGFFERNSPDTELYAPGENILLSKPTQENGIIAFALLKLYKATNYELYLDAAIKTIGIKIGEVSGLDTGYYFIRSSQFILENNYLQIINQDKKNIELIEKEKQENFWLNDIATESVKLNQKFIVSEEGLEKLNAPFILLLIIALIAGFISFASPCSLPIIPAYLAYSFRSSKQNIKLMTLSFFLGLTIIFSLLGMTATFIGNFLKNNLTFFSQIAGIGILLFGIYILFGKGFTGFKVKQKNPKTYLGSFLFGASLGISWTPCIGPILVGILLLASTASSSIAGGILLFAFGTGLALPLIILSIYLDKINKEGRLWRILQGKEIIIKIFNKKLITHTNSLISGILFIILGYLIFSGTLYSFNQLVATTSFQKYIFGLEDFLLKLVK